MENQLTVSFLYEKLFIAYLKEVDIKVLKTPILGVFKEGRPSYIHLCSRVKSADGIESLMKILAKDPSIVSYQETEGNTLLHYAVYHRNLGLVEALLNKFEI